MENDELVFSVSKQKGMDERLVFIQNVRTEDAVKVNTAFVLWGLIKYVTVDLFNDEHPLREYAEKTLDEMKSACKETLFGFVSKEEKDENKICEQK